MRIVIASTSVPNIDGGGRLIVKWTAQALREAGHEVEEYFLPFPTTARSSLAAMVGLRATPFADAGDRLIAIRWPAHVIQHENKATWFIHHYRNLFDLWDTPHRGMERESEAVAYRETLRRIDNLGLTESKDLFTNSLVVRDRVRKFNNLEAEPLFPPLGGDTSRFHTEGYGDFIFYPSRVTPIKRQLLAVEALRYTTTPVRLVIAGNPEAAYYETQIQRTIDEHKLEDRVELHMGWMAEDEKVRLLAECLALAYLPLDEDSYGYPSLEASHSSKAIITFTDAGGALEFVRDGIEGRVVEPDPRALARVFDELYEDRAMARRMGEQSFLRRAELGISWDHVVARLVGEAT